jgi:hypothetical protein
MEISRDGVSIGKHATTTCSIALQRTVLHWNTEDTLTQLFDSSRCVRACCVTPTQSLIHWLLGGSFPRVEWPVREDNDTHFIHIICLFLANSTYCKIFVAKFGTSGSKSTRSIKCLSRKTEVIALCPVIKIITRKEVKMGWGATRKKQKTTNFWAEKPNLRHYLPRRKRRQAIIDNLSRSSGNREGARGLDLNSLFCRAAGTSCEYS